MLLKTKMQTPNVNTASVPKKINKQLNAINKQIDT